MIVFLVDTEIVSLQIPDYHEIIKHPMDFGTVRKKLDGRLYSNLEELEVGKGLLNGRVYSICSSCGFNLTLTLHGLLWRQLRLLIF